MEKKDSYSQVENISKKAKIQHKKSSLPDYLPHSLLLSVPLNYFLPPLLMGKYDHPRRGIHIKEINAVSSTGSMMTLCRR